jgi:hypothetical protein
MPNEDVRKALREAGTGDALGVPITVESAGFVPDAVTGRLRKIEFPF